MTPMDRRRELLRKRIAESGVTERVSESSPRTRAGERRALTSGQRRMWFLQSKDAADTTLNICVAHRMVGSLDEQRLRDAFGTIVQRHDILRTVYAVDGEGEPYQIFQDDVELPWTTIDLASNPESEQAVGEIVHGEFGRPFDLATELPLRITLVRLAEAEFALLLVAHHICWDDSSWKVFFAELNNLYNGYQLEGLPPQFTAVGSVEEPPADDVEYWRAALTPLPEPLELPGPAITSPSRAARRRTRTLPVELIAEVERFARDHSATPFMVLLAGFGILMRRYTTASDFLVSVPVTQRNAQAEKAIGYFGNTLLLRATALPRDTFATYTAAVREACLGGFGHQNVGIDRVVREVNPSRSSGRDGMDELVRLGFSMRGDSSGYALAGVTATPLQMGAVTAQLPLSLAIVTERTATLAEMEYQTDLVSEELVDQLLAHFQRLLAGALGDPDAPLSQLDPYDADERQALMAQSRGELVAAPATTMVDLLQAACSATPEALALVSDDIELTYAQLHGRSNRLARWLIGQGIGTEDIVALRMTTSVEFIVALFAVLKSGAAYLPVDPGLPEDRIEYLLSDARPRLVLGREEFAAAEHGAFALADTHVGDADRLRPLHPENLAYVIHTSGSTGRPKGVAVSHKAIAEHVQSFVAEWSMTAQDRLLQSSSVSFDASLLDIFVTLVLGAQLVVPKPNAFADIRYVAELVVRRGVTVLHMVPSLLGALLLLPEVGELRGLRHVPVGGEALPGEVADKFATIFDAELRNHYGPTEAVVCSTHQTVHGPQGSSVVPIGAPNRDVYAYVLDEALRLSPTAVVGELYLGGAQLARGYLGRPGLTVQRFVADPFNAGGRLYRTGDLVRRNASGVLDFVGRADEQVKVRGFRIELGEIESVIGAHPHVGHCVVTVTEDPQIGPILAAYVVPAIVNGAPVQVDLDELRTHAQGMLPEYMVPSAFAVIANIPLTTSGKLDKRALPAPNPVLARVFRAPSTPTEHRICAIFGRLFGRELVSADDSFFELGGHSLLAARLVAQIRAQFGLELTVRTVFDTPTPAGLATRLVAYFRDEFEIELDEMDLDDVADGMEFAARDGRPELAKAARRPEKLPLSYSQLAMWFECQMEGASDLANMSFALRLDGPLQTSALNAALNDVVARHEPLRTNFPVHNGMPHQVVRRSLSLELPVVAATPGGLDDTLMELRHHVFGLESEPLIRATLVELGPDAHVLSLVAHHLVADHVSFSVILDDLIVAYRVRLAGDAPRWDALPVQYADYVLWQHQAFDPSSEFGQAELAFWTDQVSGLPDQIAVAHDRARPPVLGKRSEVQTFTLEPRRRASLTRLAEQSSVTEFMLYQAVLATVMHRLGGGPDIAIGSPVAARVHSATANLVGLFANMVTLRNDFSDDPTLRTVLSRSRDVVLNAHAHQDLPIERLVEAINPTRSRSWNPLFQTMLNFRGADWALTARDLTESGKTSVTPMPVDVNISFLDLNLAMNVTPAGELDVRVVANADLYDPETVWSLARALEAAFDSYTANLDQRVSEIELLPAVVMERLFAAPAPAAQRPTPLGKASPETERTLITILEDLLEISDVEVGDNFFALGGDSLISIQWSARAAQLGLQMTPQMVFEYSTISDLAAVVEAATNGQLVQEISTPASSTEQSAPMSASGLSEDALAELAASWQARS